MRTLIGLLLSLSDRRFSYPTDADGDQSFADCFGSTVKVTLRTRTLIGLLLSLSDRRFRYPSGRGRDWSLADRFGSTI